ncbi:MAG TPA: NAD(+)/NADH kinase [Vicinamibacterales bacterium]|nr:NAD(+)/NADH kinase [Vicinamibacterales bacterium]
MDRVGIIAKSHLRAATPHLVEIEAWLRNRGVEAIFETATAALMPPAPSARLILEKEEIARTASMVVLLGGDGTLLSMADCIGATGSSAPILGVNFGSLGFLTEVTLPELYPSLEAALTGQARIEERMMLRSTTLREQGAHTDHIALNDVVINKAGHSRMIDLSVSIGDEFITRIKADGLIIATPTGSTAYNLAAGGPIVQPNLDALLITPIAPHTLTNRPIVIPAASTIRIQPIMDGRDDVHVTMDGQTGFRLQAGDEIRVCRAERLLRLIRPSTRSYFEVLREKLKWGER